MALPQAIRRQKLLLAEGKDELHFSETGCESEASGVFGWIA